ncbi:MAG TPA: histidine kinase dimerization/phospho-acceptor domain-containing protein, partial [Solirubrobacteraceae bacterium]|nr:histidine kinase dimerization/phospho-acceptor domain-containing protein [Solirubrobacteraceae bacterium]
MRLQRLPFRMRLTLGFAGVMIVLFGGLALLLHTLFDDSLNQGIDRSLRTHAADITTLVHGRRTLPQLPESGGAFAQIVDPATGQVLDATPGHARPLLTRQELDSASHRGVFVDEGPRARLLAEPIATNPPGVLVVGSSLSEENGALTTLSELLFIGGPMLLLLTCLAGYVLAERALAPVENMRAHAAAIAGEPEGGRLPVPVARDELYRLGETLNEMLRRLEDALERERAFVADAGHELRTPLAILKLELELALTPGVSVDELRDRVRSAAEEVDRLAKLAQDLLVIARAEQGQLSLDKHRIEVEQVLTAVAARLGPPASSNGRAVRLEQPGRIAVDADQAWLEQALTNLVSNALRYGEGDVTLRAMRRNGSVELHVLDEGGGFEP